MVLTGMLLLGSKAEAILITEGQAKLAKPYIVVQTGASPDSRRVLLVLNREIAALLGPLPLGSRAKIWLTVKNPVCRVEKLGGL